jgi:hypothetical protein
MSSPNKRYLVQPADRPAPFPSETQLKETENASSLPDWAEERCWARALEVPYDLSTGEQGWVDRVSLHVGVWDANYVNRKRWQTAHRVYANGIQDRRAGREPGGNFQRAKAILRAADPFSVLDPDPADDGQQSRLQKVLRTGRFEVRGQVYLDPKAPLQPSPQIPEGDTERLLARMEIGGEEGFTYPDDAR